MSLQIKLKKLAKELSKLLKDSNLETVDKDVLENSQKELQKAVLFLADEKGSEHTEAEVIDNLNPNHSYLSQLDVTYKTPDLMSHFLPPHEVSFTFCCSSIVFPR